MYSINFNYSVDTWILQYSFTLDEMKLTQQTDEAYLNDIQIALEQKHSELETGLRYRVLIVKVPTKNKTCSCNIVFSISLTLLQIMCFFLCLTWNRPLKGTSPKVYLSWELSSKTGCSKKRDSNNKQDDFNLCNNFRHLVVNLILEKLFDVELKITE